MWHHMVDRIDGPHTASRLTPAADRRQIPRSLPTERIALLECRGLTAPLRAITSGRRRESWFAHTPHLLWLGLRPIRRPGSRTNRP
jgi:hypothetical protein